MFYQTGEWEYTVTNKDVDPQRVSIIVRSQPRDSINPPIVARAFWAITGEYIVVAGTMQRIFATVSRGKQYQWLKHSIEIRQFWRTIFGNKACNLVALNHLIGIYVYIVGLWKLGRHFDALNAFILIFVLMNIVFTYVF